MMLRRKLTSQHRPAARRAWWPGGGSDDRRRRRVELPGLMVAASRMKQTMVTQGLWLQPRRLMAGGAWWLGGDSGGSRRRRPEVVVAAALQGALPLMTLRVAWRWLTALMERCCVIQPLSLSGRANHCPPCS